MGCRACSSHRLRQRRLPSYSLAAVARATTVRGLGLSVVSNDGQARSACGTAHGVDPDAESTHLLARRSREPSSTDRCAALSELLRAVSSRIVFSHHLDEVRVSPFAPDVS